MDRNPDKQSQKRIRERLFTRDKPPSDRVVALDRVNELNRIIEDIQIQLETRTPGVYKSEQRYQEWARSANYALSQLRSELVFLEGWLGSRNGFSVNSVHLTNLSDRIKQKAQTLARQIRRDLGSGYSKNHLPTTLADAQARLRHLGSIMVKLQAAFGEITNEWTSRPLRKDGLSGAKAPLQLVNSDVQAEMAILKEYQTSLIRIERTSRKSVLVAALNRAVDQGFVLTKEEGDVLKEIGKVLPK